MKRSLHVSAPLLAAAALALTTGCRQQPEMQRCVDEQNHVVADNLCSASGQQPVRNPAGGFYPMMPYHLYYGGLGGYSLGSIVSGGSYNAIPGRSYANSSRASSTTRGGFGSSFGGGASGEGGGHGGSAGA